MKTMLPILFMFISMTVFCQIPNDSFEEWKNENTWEIPIGWETNNEDGFISITKVTGLVNGDHSMKVESKGVSFEGFAPGVAKVRFLPDGAFNNLKLNYFVDSLITEGSIEVIVSQRDNGFYKKIGDWRTEDLSSNVEELMIPLVSLNQDSLEVLIIANTLLTALGYEGYSSVIVDDIDISLSASLNEGVEILKPQIYPNPSSGNIFISDCTDCNYMLHDANGKLIRKGILATGKLEIATSGIYTLYVDGINFSAIERVVVLRSF